METVGSHFGGGYAGADIEMADLGWVIEFVGIERVEAIKAGDGLAEAFGENEEMIVRPENGFAIENSFGGGELGLFGVGESVGDGVGDWLGCRFERLLYLIDGEIAAVVFEIAEVTDVEVSRMVGGYVFPIHVR